MIRQIFKIMWHRKRRNFLLMVEIFFSFLVLFAVATMAISSTVQYFTPLGFSYENVWLLRASWGRMQDTDKGAEIRDKLNRIQREMESCSEVEMVSWTSFIHPYASSTSRFTIDVQGRELDVDVYDADDNHAKVLNIPLSEGRWFGPGDIVSTATPVVINNELREILFSDDPALGEIFSTERHDFIVVGVAERYCYRGEFGKTHPGFFRRVTTSDSIAARLPDVALFKIRPGTDIQFEERLIKRLTSIAPDWPLRIETLEDMRTSYLKDYMLSLGIFGVIAGFLVFNVALGLFGVLWYSISRRRREIGLRRAVGANAGEIAWQILGEALVLATLALAAGVFIGAQVPILNLDAALTGMGTSIPGTIYIFSMALAALMIYLLVAICALYPSRLASRIHPAMALHDE